MSRYSVKKICGICNNYFSSQGLPAHTKVCKGEGRVKPHKKNSPNVHLCKFCNKRFDRGNQLGGHTVTCPLNPASKEVRRKASQRMIGRVWSKSHKEKLSKIQSSLMEEKGNGGFRDIKWYRIKNTEGVEYVVRGSWELEVANWLNEKSIKWERKVYLRYHRHDGVLRRYAPDFYLPGRNIYLEVKGYYSDLDREKMMLVLEQNNIDLRMIFKQQIDNIKNGSYSL